MFLKKTVYLASGLLLAALSSCSVSNTDGVSSDTDTTITVGGSSEAYEMIEILAEAYDQAEFEFFSPSQTSGGIEGVQAEVIDIGGVSRKLTLSDLGEQLSYIPMVETPLVLVVHDSVTGVTNITAEQIQAIYGGDITNWKELGGPDATIVLFDLSEDENEKVVLREAHLGKEFEVTDQAIVFTEDDELVETLAITEFSVAAVPNENELEELPLVTVSIDGIEPTVENIQSGSYSMSMPLGLVVAQAVDAEVQAFIDFATSPEGQQLLSEADYVLAGPAE